eukprot:TRINITY_DN6402_c0_g1_i1.p1 TRINITY_DN6402_c0_g1~~TRINITY_DN6402_c0_g1_i1.p1  ORF type:complete len:662 (-),score=89.76 TRINITY_DN6402_c0_g1_i1:82-2067(-)
MSGKPVLQTSQRANRGSANACAGTGGTPGVGGGSVLRFPANVARRSSAPQPAGPSPRNIASRGSTPTVKAKTELGDSPTVAKTRREPQTATPSDGVDPNFATPRRSFVSANDSAQSHDDRRGPVPRSSRDHRGNTAADFAGTSTVSTTGSNIKVRDEPVTPTAREKSMHDALVSASQREREKDNEIQRLEIEIQRMEQMFRKQNVGGTEEMPQRDTQASSEAIAECDQLEKRCSSDLNSAVASASEEAVVSQREQALREELLQASKREEELKQTVDALKTKQGNLQDRLNVVVGMAKFLTATLQRSAHDTKSICDGSGTSPGSDPSDLAIRVVQEQLKTNADRENERDRNMVELRQLCLGIVDGISNLKPATLGTISSDCASLTATVAAGNASNSSRLGIVDGISNLKPATLGTISSDCASLTATVAAGNASNSSRGAHGDCATSITHASSLVSAATPVTDSLPRSHFPSRPHSPARLGGFCGHSFNQGHGGCSLGGSFAVQQRPRSSSPLRRALTLQPAVALPCWSTCLSPSRPRVIAPAYFQWQYVDRAPSVSGASTISSRVGTRANSLVRAPLQRDGAMTVAAPSSARLPDEGKCPTVSVPPLISVGVQPMGRGPANSLVQPQTPVNFGAQSPVTPFSSVPKVIYQQMPPFPSTPRLG